jgi:hypothetical protein
MREKQHNYNSFKNFNYQQNNRFKILAITKCYNILSPRRSYFWITTRLERKRFEKISHTTILLLAFFFLRQENQFRHHQSSIQPSRMKHNVFRIFCKNLSPIQRSTNENQRMKEDCSSCLVWFFSHGLSFSLAKPFSTAVPFAIYIRGSWHCALRSFPLLFISIVWWTTHNNSPLRYPNCNIWLCNYQNINQLFVYTVIQETNYWLWLRVCHAVDHSAYLLFFFHYG